MPIAYLLSRRTLQALRRYDFYSQAITTGMKPTAVSYPIRVRLEGAETFHWCDSYSPFAPEGRISNSFSDDEFPKSRLRFKYRPLKPQSKILKPFNPPASGILVITKKVGRFPILV